MTADTLTNALATTSHASAYPAHWRMTRLGDVARVLYGKARPHDDGDVPVIGSGGVFGTTSRALTTHETLVIGRKGAAGAVFYSSTPCYPSDTAFYLDWLDELSVPFVYFHLLHHSPAPDRSVIPSLARAEVENHSLLLPPLAEQRAIARILRAAQDAIAARRRQVTLERERKAALMQRLFTHGVRGEPTKQTEIGEMSQSWQVVRLGDVLAQTQYGLSLRGESSGDHPILRMNNLVEGHVDITDLQYVTTDDATVRQFQLAQGDILFNRTNSYELVGKTALFDLSGTFLFASYLIRVVPLAEKLLPGFLSAYLNSVRTQQRLRMLASRGVSQSNISASKLTGFLIPLPSLDEQRAIADTLAACDTHIAALEREIALHEELFRALLEELMSGRLSALPLVEESASGKA